MASNNQTQKLSRFESVRRRDIDLFKHNLPSNQSQFDRLRHINRHYRSRSHPHPTSQRLARQPHAQRDLSAERLYKETTELLQRSRQVSRQTNMPDQQETPPPPAQDIIQQAAEEPTEENPDPITNNANNADTNDTEDTTRHDNNTEGKPNLYYPIPPPINTTTIEHRSAIPSRFFRPPVFSGKPQESFIEFKQKVQKYFRHLRVSEDEFMLDFPLLLQDKAARDFDALDLEVQESLNKAMNALEEIYVSPNITQNFSAVTRRVQKDGETVQDFLSDLIRLFNDTRINDENQKVAIAITNLTPAVRRVIAPFDIKSLSHLEQLASRAELSLAQDGSTEESKLTQAINALQSRPDEQIDKLQSSVNSLAAMVKQLQTQQHRPSQTQTNYSHRNQSQTPRNRQNNYSNTSQNFTPAYNSYNNPYNNQDRRQTHNYNTHQHTQQHNYNAHQHTQQHNMQPRSQMPQNRGNISFCRQCNEAHAYAQHTNPVCGYCNNRGHVRSQCLLLNPKN